MCNDLDDGIPKDTSIEQEDEALKKKVNIPYEIRKAESKANKEQRKSEKEADKYQDYKIKGPLGHTYDVKVKNDDNKKNTQNNTPSSKTTDQAAPGGLIIEPGAKVNGDININSNTKGPVTIINK